MTDPDLDHRGAGPVEEPDQPQREPADVPTAAAPGEAGPSDPPATHGAEEGAEAPNGGSASSTGADEEVFVDGTVGRSELAAERDEYLEALQRVKAEFDNYRKRTEKQHAEMVERAGSRLAEKLLPVLDACDAAVGHGTAGVEEIRRLLLEVLAGEGLEVIDPVGEGFDPNLHEAVMREEGDGEQTVVEVLRRGYGWKGRVLRPAMVKVKG